MINNNVSKFLSKLDYYFKQIDESHCESIDQLADQYKHVHSYHHPKTNKKCHCFMRPLATGYSIINIDDDGAPVGSEEEETGSAAAERNVLSQADINDVAAVKAIAGGNVRGGLFSNPQKQIETAYGTLLSRLAGKIKRVAGKIK